MPLPTASRIGNIGVTMLPGTPRTQLILDPGVRALMIVGTAKLKDPDQQTSDRKFEYGEPQLVFRDNLADLGKEGTLPWAVDSALKQRPSFGMSPVVVLPYEHLDGDEVTNLDQVAGTQANLSGVWKALEVPAILGYHVGYIAAPGWSHQQVQDGVDADNEPVYLANPVAAEMSAVCKEIKCQGVVDAPNGTRTEALLYISTLNSDRLSAWYPWVHGRWNGESKWIPPSGVIAARMAIQDVKPWPVEALYREPLVGVDKLSQVITYDFLESTATYLGNRAVNCLIQERGAYLAYGDETTLTAGDDKKRYSIYVVRSADFLDRGVRGILQSFHGKIITPGFSATLKQETESYLDRYRQLERLLQKRFGPDPILNTHDSVQGRQFYTITQYVIAPPARSLVNQTFLEDRIRGEPDFMPAIIEASMDDNVFRLV